MMEKLIDEGLLQEKLALIPMEERTFRRTVEELDTAPPVDAIPIPDSATNGDMLKAMFPNCIKDSNFGGAVITNINGESQYWRKDWWDAPYKRGDADGNDD